MVGFGNATLQEFRVCFLNYPELKWIPSLASTLAATVVITLVIIISLHYYISYAFLEELVRKVVLFSKLLDVSVCSGMDSGTDSAGGLFIFN